MRGKQEVQQVIHIVWLYGASTLCIFSLSQGCSSSKRLDPDLDTEMRSVLSKLGYTETNIWSFNTNLQGFEEGVGCSVWCGIMGVFNVILKSRLQMNLEKVSLAKWETLKREEWIRVFIDSEKVVLNGEKFGLNVDGFVLGSDENCKGRDYQVRKLGLIPVVTGSHWRLWNHYSKSECVRRCGQRCWVTHLSKI